MESRQKTRIAALKARLEICEAERRELLMVLSTTGANLAQISLRVEELFTEFRRLTNELKLFEISELQE